MSVVTHEEHLLDRAAMLLMRTMLAAQPAVLLVPEARPAFDQLMQKTPPAETVTYESGEVNGIPGWWCRPSAACAGSVIAYFHGGAFVMGAAAAYRHFAGQIAARAKATAFIADYGLAPERPFPAAFEDAQKVYTGLTRVAHVRQIALAGDSAGGGLTLSVLRQMTAAEDAAAGSRSLRPCAAVALSPWTDLALTGGSYEDRAAADPILSRETLSAAARLYLGEHNSNDVRASPIYGDLEGLPPVLIHVGKDEVLLDDSLRYAERAAAAGSPVEVHVWQGMVHVFQSNPSLLHAARASLDLIGEFLRMAFGATV